MPVRVRYRDAISPLLEGLKEEITNYRDRRSGLRDVGDLLVRTVRESMNQQEGVADGVPYAPLSPKYARRKQRLGGPPSRPLYFHGRLAGSWRITSISSDRVVVGAGGGKINATKASAHDGGLADKLGRPELDRLRLGFSDKLLDACADAFVGRVLENADRRAPKKGK